MKNLKLSTTFISALLLLGALSAQAQATRITGKVTDSNGQAMPGVAVIVKEGAATTTAKDGSYAVDAAANSTLVFTYAGYHNREIAVNNRTSINVVFDETTIDDIVVIGYGSVRKQDLTGAVASVPESDFLKGGATADRLLVGKVAGLQITTNGGAPGSGSTIRIRGGASLSASNTPLIILDGMPLESSSVSGSPGLLSTINPDEIENMTVLKDASSTAIYGSRASNGVIMITTKQAKKGQAFKVSFTTQNQIATLAKRLEVLDGDQFREMINNSPYSSQAFRNMLGTENTDWQNEVFQNAFGTDNNLSISGAYKNLPYRVSVGYYNEDGTLKTGNMERVSGGINLNPRFFDNHLKVDVSVKGSLMDTRFANTGAINTAIKFDPTKPVYAPGFEEYGGYYTWLTPSGDFNALAASNPLFLLDQYSNTSTVKRLTTSAQVDYRLHFLPELRFNANLGYDYATGRGAVSTPNLGSYGVSRKGQYQQYGSDKANKLFEFYLNYNKYFRAIDSNVDFTAGYTYQDWLTTSLNYVDYYADRETVYKDIDFPYDKPRNTLISFFGRLNYSLADRYLLTLSLRYDGSSRFSEDNRWGTFPSAAVAWRINKENFMRNVRVLSDLKLRLSYGVTGQQDIGSNRYLYMARYRLGDDTKQYQLGDEFYKTYRPEGYDSSVRWETTTAYNIGLDFGLLKDRLTGSVDLYYKDTKDMFGQANLPGGTNFTNVLQTNVGNMSNRGIEFSINAKAIQTQDWDWDISYNISYNQNKVTNLTLVKTPNHPGYVVGGIDGTTSGTAQRHKVGYPMRTFFLYRQLYDSNGMPIEGAYLDRDNNGIINDDDKFLAYSANPKVLMGFTTNLVYRKWTLNTVMRASIGNYVYNNVASASSYVSSMFNTASNSLVNIPTAVYRSNFYNKQSYSDFYLENGSFLKMDNLSLSYDFGTILKHVKLMATGSVQNVFTVTKYTGLDPEIADGIDRDFYPRPRTFMLRLNLTF